VEQKCEKMTSGPDIDPIWQPRRNSTEMGQMGGIRAIVQMENCNDRFGFNLELLSISKSSPVEKDQFWRSNGHCETVWGNAITIKPMVSTGRILEKL
jgi:hypothetical protein